MKKTLTFNTGILLLAGSLLLTACNKSLETDPTSKYDEETFWYSAKGANGGLTGCYNALMQTGVYGNGTVLWEEAASPNAYNYDNRNGYNDIALGTHTANTAAPAARWKACYAGIGRCNLLVAKIYNNKELAKEQLDKMQAEARFLRAFYYNLLITYFNEVPLITAPADLSQRSLPRTPHQEIVSFLLTELDAIAKVLPPAYTATADKGRITSGAALALKAKILLFEASPLLNPTGDRTKWKAAADAAEVVMGLQYSLFSNYRTLFMPANEYSTECIFDVQFLGPNVGSSFDVTLRQFNNCAPLRELIDFYLMKDGKPRNTSSVTDPANYYNNMDPRFAQTVVYPGATYIGSVVANNKFVQTGYTFKKYSVYDANTATAAEIALGDNQSGINYMVIRYADILMSYAEAKNEMNELTADVWNKTIRPIRQRAGFTDANALDYPTGASQDSLRNIIHYERRAEFAGEGFYYNDIRRWKLAEKVMNTTIYKYDNTPIITRTFDAARDYWWPVPASEIDLNTQLSQNPGNY